MDSTKGSPSTGRGNFFAVDRRSFARACAVGLNPAVAYVVLARFSGRDNEHTAASVHAIETHTGISRGRAREALDTLVEHELVRVLQSGTKPRYQLAPYAELPGAAPPPMTAEERSVYERIKAGEGQLPRDLVKHRNSLVRKRWVRREPGCGFSALQDALLLYTPQNCWLPNTIVDSAAEETSPLDLLRQTQDVMTLRMFVDLYYEHMLTEHGGLPRTTFRKAWERERVGARGEHVVWGFKQDGSTNGSWNELTLPHKRQQLTDSQKDAGEHDATDLWTRLGRLVGLGLVQWVPHLFESGTDDAEAIHPYCFSGEAVERELAKTCRDAAYALLREDQQNAAVEKGLLLAPVKAHIDNVQMVSVARLRYRPHTALTSAWWAELLKSCAGYQAAYMALAGRAEVTRFEVNTGT